MMFGSLSAPALLDYGLLQKVIGTHASQSLEVYEALALGDVEVRIYGREITEGLGSKWPLSYNLVWSQDGRDVATGKSFVFPMGIAA